MSKNQYHSKYRLTASFAFLLAGVRTGPLPAQTTRPSSQPESQLRAIGGSPSLAIELDRRAAAGAGAKVTVVPWDRTVRLMNNRVVVTVDEGGKWDATWLSPAEAAVHGAVSLVQVNGPFVTPTNVQVETGPFLDPLGDSVQIKQSWGDTTRIERVIHVYHGRPAITISGRITNAGKQEATLGTVRLLAIGSEDGSAWWHVGHTRQAPAVVYVNGLSELLCEPASDPDPKKPAGRAYNGTTVLALANRNPSNPSNPSNPTSALVVGFLTAAKARPDLSARFLPGKGGTEFSAELKYFDRKLAPGETIELETVYLAAGPDPFAALEQYGDAAAAFSQRPVRKGASSLWCSWYAHRMAMTEDLVLANAAVAARHFKPLGMEIIQLDHGWQRGDITGDWIANERFPHGLKSLADQLQSRYGFKLGIWIAPTDVAATSELFKAHPDWMLMDEAGKPRVNWKWYWKPNPDCYELDATIPAAARWIEDTFARLSADGVSYFKIDFIAASGGEAFRQHDPRTTRGWSALHKAMSAIRQGAGPNAWVRYCQTPPLLSAGLANSAYGGDDTLDAGVPGRFDVLRTNARHLAAGYWLNDRLYHREVCDMSVRMQADIEEVRLRLAMMTLGGCSISFSDEFQYLPPSRIRMMQQCLPPGNPPMRPLDLFDRAEPSIWQVHCKNAADEWDVVGLFNFEDSPRERRLEFASIGLPADADLAAFEFWEERFAGVHRKELTVILPPQASRIFALRRLTGRPQIVGMDMHVLQGFHEIRRLTWDANSKTLSGQYRRMPGLTCRAYWYLPPGWQPHFDFPLAVGSARLTHIAGPIWMQEVAFEKTESDWSIPFDGP